MFNVPCLMNDNKVVEHQQLPRFIGREIILGRENEVTTE